MRAALALCAALALAGCGFQPMYATNNAAATSAVSQLALGAVDGADEATRAFRDAAQGFFPADEASAAYRVELGLDGRRRFVSVQLDNSTTRNNYILRANWRLIDVATGNVLTRGESEATASYSILDAQYAAYVSEQDAVRRAAGVVADDIAREAAAYFAASGAQ